MFLTTVLGILAIYAVTAFWFHRRYPEVMWDWSSINSSDTQFPKDFVWGSATAAHQVEGNNDNSNWWRWEHEPNPKTGQSRILNGDKSGLAADHYNLYREDIARMRDELGIKSYRFSLAWSRIEPEPGRYDSEAIAHYHDVIDTLLEAGISPMITLHHFTHPIW
ncbi:MAG: family 1 glycosylhydrolase, partial [Myxococcota bacterium]|nr:family 1 glycosylhydrolase [Myxococcota bacterium]